MHLSLLLLLFLPGFFQLPFDRWPGPCCLLPGDSWCKTRVCRERMIVHLKQRCRSNGNTKTSAFFLLHQRCLIHTENPDNDSVYGDNLILC
jgi:hypothetical protein